MARLAAAAVVLLACFATLGVAHRKHERAAERHRWEVRAREAGIYLRSLTPAETARMARYLLEHPESLRYAEPSP
jgi:hypothetical protein